MSVFKVCSFPYVILCVYSCTLLGCVDELYLKNRPPNVMELVNRTVTFTCEFRSHHLNSWTVTWFHGNPEVVEDSRRTFTSAANGDHSLTIRNLTVADHGMYTCKGVLNNTLKNNEIEEEIASFNLTSIGECCWGCPLLPCLVYVLVEFR